MSQPEHWRPATRYILIYVYRGTITVFALNAQLRFKGVFQGVRTQQKESWVINIKFNTHVAKNAQSISVNLRI